MKISKKIKVFAVLFAFAVICILAVLKSRSVPSESETGQDKENVQSEGERAISIRQEPSVTPALTASPFPTVTIAPTSTPKPLPTAVPTAIPTAAPTTSLSSGPAQIPGQENGIGTSGEGTVEPQESQWVLNRIIFIGDSRTGEMSEVSSESDELWLYQDSAGYDYLINSAFPNADPYVGQGTAVVIALGINDLYNANNYVAALDQKTALWKDMGVRVYFVAVGPIDYDLNTDNQEIMDFNTAIYNGITDGYFIDAYNYLVRNGYATVDGVHYDTVTTESMYQYIRSCIQ